METVRRRFWLVLMAIVMTGTAATRVHISGFGPDAVSLVMTYWYHLPDSTRFAAFNEGLNLVLHSQFQAAGIRLATRREARP